MKVGRAPETVSQEPQPIGTLELLAELGVLRDRFSQLEVEVEALKNKLNTWGSRRLGVRDLEGFFLNFPGLPGSLCPGDRLSVSPIPGKELV